MASSSKNQTIRIHDREFSIFDLTDFGFTADSAFPTDATSGRLSLGQIEIETEFRTRHRTEDRSYYFFSNISSEDRARIKMYLDTLTNKTNGQYTHAAPVVTTSDSPEESKTPIVAPSVPPISRPASTSPIQSAPPERKTTPPKTPEPKPAPNPQTTHDSSQATTALAATTASRSTAANLENSNSSRNQTLLRALPWVLLLGLLAYQFWPSGASDDNAQDHDHRMTVNTFSHGEIIEFLVDVGDTVKQGDPLLRIAKEFSDSEIDELKQKEERTQAEFRAIHGKLQVQKRKMELLATQREMKLEAAELELATADKARSVAQEAHDRMRPFFESGAISKVEFEKVEITLLAAKSAWLEKNKVVQDLRFAEQAAKSKILVEGDSISDELAKLEIELEHVEAKVIDLKEQLVDSDDGTTFSLYAPCDGEVQKILKKAGDFVQRDEHLMYLNQAE